MIRNFRETPRNPQVLELRGAGAMCAFCVPQSSAFLRAVPSILQLKASCLSLVGQAWYMVWKHPACIIVLPAGILRSTLSQCLREVVLAVSLGNG